MKISFFTFIFFSLITSSVYAHSNFCPEANLSEEQKAQIKEQKRAVWADFHAHILDTVPATEEQKAALAECFERKKQHRNFCPEANLSEEQKAQVKELRKQSRASSHDMSREDKKAAWEELQQNILNTVSATEEQKAALAECFEHRKKRGKKHKNFCPEANLSEEQKAQIKEQKRAVWADFHAHILDTVSATEEQKAALAECFEHRKKRGKKHKKH